MTAGVAAALVALRRGGVLALTAARARRFRAGLEDPAAAQRATLDRITRIVGGSPYARRVGLRPGAGYGAFAHVPIVDYDTVAPWVREQVETGRPLLSRQPPVVYERTSGSSGRTKLIPYTASLLSAFNSCFVVWAHDLVAHGPSFRTGRIFLSVSPPLQEGDRTPTGVPISLADDAAYLAPWIRYVFRHAFFAPANIKHIRAAPAYRRALAALLIAERRLEIISIWSPTYLLALLDGIVAGRADIAADLRRGRTGPPDMAVSFAPVERARVALLERDPVPWEQLWPELKLLSCWTDGASAGFIPAIRRAFPSVVLQGKGLLSTEAPITVPLLRAPAPVPLLDEVFLEFEAADGAIRLLHELEDDAEYTVIVTQSGGLLRYRTNDRVRAAGRIARTPCLRFLGRAGQVSDLAGEKLGEEFVCSALAQVFGPAHHCSFLQPEMLPEGPPRYRCVTDSVRAVAGAAVVAAQLDCALRQSYQYHQCRLLGQLAGVAVQYDQEARNAYEQAQLARGVTWGGIKFSALLLPDAQPECRSSRQLEPSRT